MERSDEYVGYKIRLNPTEEQIQIFNKYFGMVRFVYNLGINLEEQHYFSQNGKYKTMSFYDLCTIFTELKLIYEYVWLNQFNIHSIRIVLRDLVDAYKKFFDGHCYKPKYKTRKKSKKSFPVRSDRLSVYNDHVKISSIGIINVDQNIENCIKGNGYNKIVSMNHLKYTDARISYDGLYYYLSFSLPKDDTHNIHSYHKYGGNNEYVERESSNSIGIDLGCKGYNWIVDSAGNRIELPDFSKEEHKLKGLHKKLSRQLSTNAKKRRKPSFKQNKPVLYERTKNEQKTIAKINKYYKRIKNRRRNKVYEYCKTLLELKPKSVVLEDLNVKNWIKENKIRSLNGNRYTMNNNISLSSLYETASIISKTLGSNNIPIIFADREYPSSQICSCCGYQQKIGRKRYFRCPQCGTVIDRDYNASLNLAGLGL